MRRTLLALLVLFAACQLEPRQATGPTLKVGQVIVVPDTISIDPLGSVQFQAYGRTTSGDSIGVFVQWSASVGSINSDAVYTADAADGDADIIAQLGGGPDEVPLVSTAKVYKRKIVALLLSPSTVTLPPGGIQQFSTDAIRAIGDTVIISPTYSATGGSIVSSGLYRAGSIPGTYRVIASRPSGVFDTAHVTIADAPVASVAVNPSAANVPVGGATQLTATTRDAAGNILSGRAVTWSSDAPAVATVSATGVVSGIAAGIATITATSEGRSGSAAITVAMVPVARVLVAPPTANLRVGTTAFFIATAEDASGSPLSGRTITWSSDAPSVASVTVDGLVSAVALGTVTITATSEGQSGSSSVTVSAVPVATISVLPASANLRVGTSVQLSATTKDSANNILNGRPVTWSSSAPGVASVSASGVVAAVAAGSATITATSEGRTGTTAITVTIVPVSSVAVTPASVALRVGGNTQLSATTTDSANNVLTGRTVTWSSSATGVATASASGVVTAVAAGSATITATSEGKSGTASIAVTVAPVASVSISPSTATLRVGNKVQLSATMIDSAGNVLTGRVVTWSSNAPAVATVSTTGQVTAVATGSATITATSEGKTAAATITVTLIPVNSVTVTPSSGSLLIGRTLQLTATTKDSAGNTLSGRVVTWSSSATGVATVSATGLVTAVAAGAVTITGTSEGKNGAAAITVSLVPVATVAVTPATGSLTNGATLQLSAVTKDSAGNTLAGRVVTWLSSAPAVATVSASGLVTAVSAGSATITATSEGKSGTSAITVTAVPVATVTVAPATKTLRVGTTAQLSAATKDSAGNTLTGRVVTWSSSAPAVATVSASGLVTAVSAGSATITATSEGKSGTSAITVTVMPVSTVAVTPASGSINVGATLQLSAVTKDSAGTVLTGRVVTWSSSATGVATVSVNGVVTAVAVGSATITATSEGKSGTSTISVTMPATHQGWYVATSGTSGGDGSSARPWNLQTALNGGGGRVQPGDTIWLRGGTYSGTFSSNLNGNAANWIVVRQYPGERATLDGGTILNDVLTVNGSYTMYWGFELMVSGTQRFGAAGTGTGLRGDGVYVNSAHDVKLINLIVHDVGHGTYLENTAHNIEVYGWIIYNGGYQDNIRSDGHGIYIKGDGIGWKIARDNVIFNQFGFGIHGYAESNTQLKQLVFDGNVVFNSGTPSSYENPNMQLGGLTIADNDTVTNNMTYYSPGVTSSGNGGVRIGYNSTANGTAVFRNNYIIGGTLTLDMGYWANLTVQGNTIAGPSVLLAQHDGASASTQLWSGDMHYRDPNASAWMIGNSSYSFANWESRSGATDQASATMPSAPKVFVRPNRYEAGRANIVIYNWTLQSSVAVDLSGVVTPGNRYEVRNVQDIFGTPVVSGTYSGGTINVPMNGVTPPQPIGGAFGTLHKTGPNFDVFIVTSAP